MFDPYHKWLGIPPEEQPANHYQLLGLVTFETDVDVIANAADRQMAHVRTFHAGPNAGSSQRLLNEISRARVCLLDPSAKAAYDTRLRGALAPAREPPPLRVARRQPQPPISTAVLVAAGGAGLIITALILTFFFDVDLADSFGGRDRAIASGDSTEHPEFEAAGAGVIPDRRATIGDSFKSREAVQKQSDPRFTQVGRLVQVTSHTWKRRQPATRLLHRSEGFAVLTRLGGAFEGFGEEVRVLLGSNGLKFFYSTYRHGFNEEAKTVSCYNQRTIRPESHGEGLA